MPGVAQRGENLIEPREEEAASVSPFKGLKDAVIAGERRIPGRSRVAMPGSTWHPKALETRDTGGEGWPPVEELPSPGRPPGAVKAGQFGLCFHLGLVTSRPAPQGHYELGKGRDIFHELKLTDRIVKAIVRAAGAPGTHLVIIPSAPRIAYSTHTPPNSQEYTHCAPKFQNKIRDRVRN